MKSIFGTKAELYMRIDSLEWQLKYTEEKVEELEARLREEEEARENARGDRINKIIDMIDSASHMESCLLDLEGYGQEQCRLDVGRGRKHGRHSGARVYGSGDR